MRYLHEGHEETGLPWLADIALRKEILPGGAQLDAAAFTEAAFPGGLIQSGTLVGRMRADEQAGIGFKPARVAPDVNPHEQFYLVLADVVNVKEKSDVELCRHRSLVRYNYLPGWATLAAGAKAQIHSLYETTQGNRYVQPGYTGLAQ